MLTEQFSILLIEDDVLQGRLLRQMLEVATPHPPNIEQVFDLATGLEKSKLPYDLTILDLGLPDSNGINTLLRYRRQCPKVPVVILTSGHDQKMAHEALRLGAQDYLVKGKFDPHLLFRALRYAHERHMLYLEREKRNQEIALANSELKTLDELKTKFISDLSHEIRTPLTSIELYAGLLKKGRAENHSRYIDIILEQSQRLNFLVSDVFDLARLTMLRHQDLDFAQLNVGKLVQQLLQKYAYQAQEKALTIHIKPNIDTQDGGLVPLPSLNIEGLEKPLLLALGHLIDNAIKYTNSGTITIHLGCEQVSEGVTFCIKNPGNGFTPTDQKHMFDRFYRGKQVGGSNKPGLGIGLAFAKEVAELHGGTLNYAYLADDQMHRFRLQIPQYRAASLRGN